MENLLKTKIVIVCIILLFISCNNNKQSKQNANSNITDERIKNLSKEKDTICLGSHFLCKKFIDIEGVKHIVVDEKSVKSEIYDAIEEEKVINASVQLIFKIFLNN